MLLDLHDSKDPRSHCGVLYIEKSVPFSGPFPCAFPQVSFLCPILGFPSTHLLCSLALFPPLLQSFNISPFPLSPQLRRVNHRPSTMPLPQQDRRHASARQNRSSQSSAQSAPPASRSPATARASRLVGHNSHVQSSTRVYDGVPYRRRDLPKY
jgi:hypothetical protein